MRGKGPISPSASAYIRITPACAWKSDHLALSHSLPQDHPRVCGEKNSALSSSDSHSGSPPRVRGKGTRRVRRSPRRRITPACAGKSVLPSPEGFGMGDHPRVCGEKHLLVRLTFAASGSPPRVRGKGSVRKAVMQGSGITPACAGKRRGLMKMICWRRDHPRVCGEKLSSAKQLSCSVGSPPRVRGKDERC